MAGTPIQFTRKPPPSPPNSIPAEAPTHAATLMGHEQVTPATSSEAPEASASKTRVSTDAEITLPVIGMHCANCAGAVERAARSVLGVRSAAVNFATETLQLAFSDAPQGSAGHAPSPPEASPGMALGAVAEAVANAGYRVVLPEPGRAVVDAHRAARARMDDARAHRFEVLLGVACSVPLLVVGMGGDLGLLGDALDMRTRAWISLFLALPVQFVLGGRFALGAIRALRQGVPNMDVLVALGAWTAFVYSVAALFWPGFFDPPVDLMGASHDGWGTGNGLGAEEGGTSFGHVYFETAALILTVVRLGKWLEAQARDRARDRIQATEELLPPVAHLVENATERDIPAGALVPGDRVRVRPGERFPADGIVDDGVSHSNDAALTGESLPRRVSPGDKVWAGGINGDGALTMVVKKVGEATRLGRAVRLLHGALGSKPAVQALVDRISAYFVPAVIAVALLAGLGWALAGEPRFGLLRAVSVLVVACPCALGLAVPAALAVALGRAHGWGLRFSDADALWRAAGVRTLFFDKTGTLTLGRPDIIRVEIDSAGCPDTASSGATTEEIVLRTAAALARHSNHPHARAVWRAAKQRGIESAAATLRVDAVREHPGEGVEGVIDGVRWRLGRMGHSMGGGGDSALSSASSAADSPSQVGSTATYAPRTALFRGDERIPVAVFHLADAPRPEAKAVVASLRHLGIRTVILSGDRTEVATELARDLGIDEALGERGPAEKVAAVTDAVAQAPGTVAMVGDGINDAAALSRADVSMAMGGGAEVARVVAHVTVASSDLHAISRALRLARAFRDTVGYNLVGAFAYNVLLIPVAAGALRLIPGTPMFLADLHPALAAAAMALSSVTVLGYSLRLENLPFEDHPGQIPSR